MTKELYVDIYNLITDSISEKEEQRDKALDVMVLNRGNRGADVFKDNAEQAIECHRKMQELNRLLDRFDNEIDEPV